MNIDISIEEALLKARPQLRKKMEHTMDVILNALPLAKKYDDKGFYVGFSGGKDSQALFHMMQLCNVPFFAYFSPTSIDCPEAIRFIKTYYPEVEFVKIEKNIFDVFRDMKILPSMKIRWCCAHFKERGGEGKVVCTGVRKAESVKRSKRNEIEVSGRKFSGHIDEFEDWQEKRIRKKMKNLNQDQFSEAKENEVRCINGKDKILLNPIIDWTEEDVWSFLNDVVEVPHCELYDQGWTRIGCICCPMATVKNTYRDIERWPHVKEKWIKAIMDVRRESILANTPPHQNQSLESSQSMDCTPPYSRHSQVNTPEWERQLNDSGKSVNNCKTKSGGGQNDPTPRHPAMPPLSSSGIWRDEIDRALSKLPPPRSSSPIRIQTECSDTSTPHGDMVGKFLDSDNGEASAVVAEYDEARERLIAEAIFEWWISKKSFKQWFAETYQQQTFNFDED